MTFQTEQRPDISIGLTKEVVGGSATYLAPQIFPIYNTHERGGQIALAKHITDSGTKNRTAGTVLSGTRVEPKDITYAVNRVEGRSYLTDSDIIDCGGEDCAIAAGARVAAAGTLALMETDAASAVFTSGAMNDAIPIASGDGFDGLLEAAEKVKHYGKAPTLVCGEGFWRKWIKLPAVREVLTDLYSHTVISQAVVGTSEACDAVGAAFGVKKVLIGDGTYWDKTGTGAASGTNYAAVINLPEEAQSDTIVYAKSFPVYGIQTVYIPENATAEAPFVVETGYDVTTKRNIVDAEIMASVNVVNSEACQLVKLA